MTRPDLGQEQTDHPARRHPPDRAGRAWPQRQPGPDDAPQALGTDEGVGGGVLQRRLLSPAPAEAGWRLGPPLRPSRANSPKGSGGEEVET